MAPARWVDTALALAATIALLLAASSPANAQDAGWDRRFGPAPVTNGAIYAVLVHEGVVYVGGAFTIIDDEPAGHVARWDERRNRWVGLGAGVDGEVFDLAEFAGSIYAAGTFARADDRPARGIARWDLSSSAWSAVGDPAIFTNTTGANRGFFCLLPRADGLYVGGNLTLVTDQRTGGVFRYRHDLDSWSHLGGGIDTSGTVSAMASMGESIAVGGYFRWVGRPSAPAGSLALYNPGVGTWEPIPQGVRGTVNALTVVDSVLWVGGAFDTLGGRSPNLATWDFHAGARTWARVGAGVGSFTRVVSTMAWDGSKMHVGLRLYATSDQPTLLEVDPRTMEMRPSALRPSLDVRDLAVVDGRLFVAGAFEFVGPNPFRRIAVRELGTGRWSTYASHLYLAPSGPVLALAPDGRGGVIVGGTFQWVGFDVANNIALWDGERWLPLASGVNGTVRAIAVDGDSVYVGGDFTTAGGVPAPYFARYDRTTATWASMGTAFDGPVHAIAIGPAHTVYVGGEFTHTGEMLARGVAYWNTRWWAFGVGPTNGVDGTVRALAMVGTALYVGGSFISAGGNPDISHLARWGGTAPGFSQVGDGVDNPINALYASGGSLIVGGPIGRAGDVVTHGIARWDGSSWHALGAGLGGGGTVNAITNYGDRLVATGTFDASGSSPAQRLAMFDGTGWSEFSGGIDAAGSALATVGARLFVGGALRTVGGSVRSEFLGAWQGTATTGRPASDSHDMIIGVDPNPASGATMLRLSAPRPSAAARVVIVDALGVPRRSLDLGFLPSGPVRIPLDLDGLAPGAYLLSIDAGGTRASSMLIVR